MPASVSIYTTSWCPYCHRAKALLSRKNVRFEEVDVDGRPELRRWLHTESGQHTVPQVFINNRPVGGYTDISALDREGRLEAMLAEDPPRGLPDLPR
jgi:glutaredoxin 3